MKGVLLAAGAVLAVAAGCSSLSPVNPRAMTVDDVASLTAAGVGADVITRQIEVTRSRFELRPEEIIRLKRAGVADEVLTVMIDSGEKREPYSAGPGYSPYDWRYDPYYTDYFGPYGPPYMVYRNPGLVGRYYSYYPLSRGYGYWYGPYREDDAYRNSRNWVRPGTGRTANPDTSGVFRQDRNP